MYDIIPLLLILISLTVTIVIVTRKFSVLAALDVESIPAEKEAKFKERIISNRLKRNFIKYFAKAVRILEPVGQAIGNYFIAKLRKLYQAKSDYRPNDQVDGKAAADQLFSQAEELKKRDSQRDVQRAFRERNK